MSYGVNMKRIPQVGRHDIFEKAMDVLSASVGREQPDAARYPLDVSVDRQDLSWESVHHHTLRGLHADAG
jgi:hypothetical protein